MFYSYKNLYPINETELPDRIRLSSGMTRTDRTTFTAEELLDAGYVPVADPPDTSVTEKLIWSGTDWEIVQYTQAELDQRIEILWQDIRNTRNSLLNELDWRYHRYNSEVRLGREPTDDIRELDIYAQALRDITLQSDPRNIIWPTLSTDSQNNSSAGSSTQ
jgi:hypothetical protein